MLEFDITTDVIAFIHSVSKRTHIPVEIAFLKICDAFVLLKENGFYDKVLNDIRGEKNE